MANFLDLIGRETMFEKLPGKPNDVLYVSAKSGAKRMLEFVTESEKDHFLNATEMMRQHLLMNQMTGEEGGEVKLEAATFSRL